MAGLAEFVVLVGACIIAGGFVGLVVGVACIIGDFVIDYRERQRRRAIRQAIRMSTNLKLAEWARKAS